MRQYILLTALAIFLSCSIKAQSEQVLELVRDSIINTLSIERTIAESLVDELFSIEQQRSNTLSDTVSTYKQKHERRLLLAIEREAVLRKWLTTEKYQLWKQVYKGRSDPVMLAWKRNNPGRHKEQ